MYSLVGLVRQKSHAAFKVFTFSQHETDDDSYFEELERSGSLLKRRKSKGAKQTTLDDIAQSTRLEKREIRMLYRSFKHAFPSGFVTSDNIADILRELFPDGYVMPYAELLFGVMEKDCNGQVTFREMCSLVSLTAKATLYNKLLWAFKMYDTDHDGVISREDLMHVLMAVYRLLGDSSIQIVSKGTVNRHADALFQKLDTDGDGVIEKNEFLENCERDPQLCEGMLMYAAPSYSAFEITHSQMSEKPAQFKRALLRRSGTLSSEGPPPSTPTGTPTGRFPSPLPEESGPGGGHQELESSPNPSSSPSSSTSLLIKSLPPPPPSYVISSPRRSTTTVKTQQKSNQQDFKLPLERRKVIDQVPGDEFM